MKKLFLFFFSISLSVAGICQPYQSIYGDSSTTWSLVKAGYCDNVCSAFYSPEGDTLINANNYKILPDYGFIREDSAQGKLWFYDEYWNQEFLVMDLNLNVSDNFTIYTYGGIPELFQVDSITFILGKKHVYLNADIFICGMAEPLVFVEGSGPNAGFNYQRLSGGAYLNSYMLCHSKNDIQVQGNTMFMGICEMCEVGLEELETLQKDLIKVCDYLGKETPVQNNTPLLFYYSDGTIRKMMIVD